MTRTDFEFSTDVTNIAKLVNDLSTLDKLRVYVGYAGRPRVLQCTSYSGYNLFEELKNFNVGPAYRLTRGVHIGHLLSASFVLHVH